MIKIAPSILSADFSRLGEEIISVHQAGCDYLHIDVMDGHFVPNITIGPCVIKALRDISNLVFDVHLMIEKPENFIEEFVKSGADIVTVHAETCTHLNRILQRIRQCGAKAGVALNPATGLDAIEWILDEVDVVLLMTVNPGFGGQKFIHSVLNKIEKIKNMANSRNLNIDIEVDGGIDTDNAKIVKEKGANIIVSGSTIFNSKDKKLIIDKLRMG